MRADTSRNNCPFIMAYMFFRHERPKVLSFDDHLSKARAEGFSVQSGNGGTRIERGGVACFVREGQGGFPMIAERPGVVMGSEIGSLTDGGFQKFFRTPHGKIKPALAEELVAVQNFSEDLREALAGNQCRCTGYMGIFRSVGAAQSK